MSIRGLEKNSSNENEDETRSSEELILVQKEGLLEDLRASLNLHIEQQWVAIKSSLIRFSVKLGKNMAYFPTMINCLKRLGIKDSISGLKIFVEMGERLGVDPFAIEMFFEKLMLIEAEDFEVVMDTIKEISPKTWGEANWYLYLIQETDPPMALFTAMCAKSANVKSNIHHFFLIQVARTGRLEALDKFVEFLETVGQMGMDIGREMEIIMEKLDEEKFVEAELILAALNNVYQGNLGKLEA